MGQGSMDDKDSGKTQEEQESNGADLPRPADPPRDIAQRIEDLPPSDGAAILQKLPKDLAADVTEYLDPNTAAAVLVEMDPTLAAAVIHDMEPPEASMVLAAIPPDDRVDVLEHIPRALHETLLGEMTAAEAAETRELEKYPPDTAGGIMTPQVTALEESLSVEVAISELRRLNETLEQMFYVYVVDRRRHLVGVLSMRDLIMSRPEKRLAQIMHPNGMSVAATMDQGQGGDNFPKRNYLGMPVVDERNRLLGIITSDDVMDVIQEEANEDVRKLFGAGVEERLTSPWQLSFRKRVWWLQFNLATAFLAAAVVGIFKQTIEALPILAAYQTIVSGMGGNASAQAMAVAIRGIALGEVDYAMLRRILYREVIVRLLSGIVIGITTAIIAATFHYSEHGVLLGIVVMLALVINHVMACISGVSI